MPNTHRESIDLWFRSAVHGKVSNVIQAVLSKSKLRLKGTAGTSTTTIAVVTAAATAVVSSAVCVVVCMGALVAVRVVVIVVLSAAVPVAMAVQALLAVSVAAPGVAEVGGAHRTAHAVLLGLPMAAVDTTGPPAGYFHLITPERWMKDFDEAGFKDKVKPLILKDNAMRLLKLGPYAGG